MGNKMNVRLGRVHTEDGGVNAVSSKSHVHRLLIAAALSMEETLIKTNMISEDMEATISCLNLLGAKITTTRSQVNIVPIKADSHIDKGNILFCNESGSTARFLLPLAALLLDDFIMEGAGKLPKRPFAPICKVLKGNGLEVSADFLPIHVKGRLKSGIFQIAGNVSSQYISGLLFALPLLEGESRIELTTELTSVSYVKLTLAVLKQFGIRIVEEKHGYVICGGQSYHSPGVIQAEGDWSNAAFFLGMGAMGNKITVRGLMMDSLQGDKQIIDLIRWFGADVSTIDREGSTEVTVCGSDLIGIEADVSQIPDLVPPLAMIAAKAEGVSRFHHVERLRIKESDRIESICNMLNAFGVKAYTAETPGETTLVVEGGMTFHGGVVDSANDHRIVMAATMGACIANDIVISQAEATCKSYPHFFEDYEVCFHTKALKTMD